MCCVHSVDFDREHVFMSSGLAVSGGRRSFGSTSESRPALLPPPLPQDADKKCLVLDLDETLVRSSSEPIANPDFIIAVETDNVCAVYLLCVCLALCVLR
jgi:hypothetical protein